MLAGLAWVLAGALVVMAWVTHIVGAAEYCKLHKRSGLETMALMLLMTVAFPLFSIGMMCQGYAAFYERHWGAAAKDRAERISRGLG